MSWAALQWAETVDLQLVADDLGDVSGAKLTAARLVLLLLARRANDCGHCWPSQTTLASSACRTERSLRDVIGMLATSLYIDRHARNFFGHAQRTDVYEVLFPGRFTVTECPACALFPAEPVELMPPGVEPRLPAPLTGTKRATHRNASSGVQRNTSSGEHPLEEITRRNNQGEPEPALMRMHEDDPVWLTTLHEIKEWSCAYDEGMLRQATDHGVRNEDALITATAAVAKWDPRKWKRPDQMFRNWMLSDKRRQEGFNGNGKSQGSVSPIEAGRAGAFADSSRYERLAEEQRLRGLQ